MRLMSLVLIGLVFSASLATTARAASTVSLQGCVLVNKPNSYTPGRFIWKPLGAHFPGNGVIVTPRYYYPKPPLVLLLTSTNQLIGTARLKSTGVCAGSPECLFAASYLTPQNGASLQRGYGSIKVRVSATSPGTGKVCTYYVINKPASRAEYYGVIH
jgi:hypothetical protein